jgi:hypothetical protein
MHDWLHVSFAMVNCSGVKIGRCKSKAVHGDITVMPLIHLESYYTITVPLRRLSHPFAWTTVVTTAKFYVLAFNMPFHISHFDFSNMLLIESLPRLQTVQADSYPDATNQ